MWKIVSTVAAVSILGGCGAVLPVMDLKHPEGPKFNSFVRLIAVHVRCELSRAVKLEYSPRDEKRAFLIDWGAKIALTLKAEDKGKIEPTISSVNSLGLFTISAGAGVNADATREMTMTYFIPFRELLSDPDRTSCERHQREPIAGDLHIHQTLESGLETWDGMYTALSETMANGETWDTITHHVTFQVEATASATPSWEIVRVTVNPSGPSLSASRTRTDELLITMGPTVLAGKKVLPVPSGALNEAFATERLRSVIRQEP